MYGKINIHIYQVLKTLIKIIQNFDGIKSSQNLNCKNYSHGLGGRVKNVRIHGDFGTDQISGVDIRKKMNLKSTLVRFKFVEDNEFKSLNDTPKLLSTNGLENEPLTHIVRVGDTLIVIADQYDVSVIGQRLLVPRNPLNSSSSPAKILVVSGFGSGHGVGMSQWGAKHLLKNIFYKNYFALRTNFGFILVLSSFKKPIPSNFFLLSITFMGFL